MAPLFVKNQTAAKKTSLTVGYLAGLGPDTTAHTTASTPLAADKQKVISPRRRDKLLHPHQGGTNMPPTQQQPKP
jgi:hypothetical protein